MNISRGRLDIAKEAEFQREVLTSPDLQKSIKLLEDVVQTSFGPQGRLKSIQNCSGGHLTLSSASPRLLGALSVSKPILKIVLSSVLVHIRTYGDGGLFSALLSLALIDVSLRLSLQRHVIINLYDYMLDMAVSYLISLECECKVAVDGNKLGPLMKLTKSVIGTKPLCGLRGHTLEYISKLLIEAFLKALPENTRQTCTPKNVHFVTEYGYPVTESKIFEGVLLDTCERDISCVKTINNELPSGKNIPVVVVNVSMSGDLEDYIEAEVYELSYDVDIDDVSMKRLRYFAEALVMAGVQAVFCQKVVTPGIRTYFIRQGVLVIDRLGGAVCNTVLKLTGAPVISCISSTLDSVCIGSLASVTIEEFHTKSYLLLQSSLANDVTVILCNRQEEMAEELKCVSEGAIQTLYQHLHKPDLLSGGGCWQTCTAQHIRQQILWKADTVMNKFHVSKSQLFEVCEAFSHCLELCAMALSKEGECHMTDTANHHLWKGPSACWDYEVSCDLYEKCSCGKFSRRETTMLKPLAMSSGPNDSLRAVFEAGKNERIGQLSIKCPESVDILDLLAVQLHALQTAVMTACAVLNINQYIKDIN